MDAELRRAAKQGLVIESKSSANSTATQEAKQNSRAKQPLPLETNINKNILEQAKLAVANSIW